MSYKNLLKMRCNILRATQTQVDGLATESWAEIETSSRCFLDLNYIRAGKDPVWTPDDGTAQNRSGVLFLPPTTLGRPGDRVQMLKGPNGTFEIQSSMDEAWTPRAIHHLECFVAEVNRTYVPGVN